MVLGLVSAGCSSVAPIRLSDATQELNKHVAPACPWSSTGWTEEGMWGREVWQRGGTVEALKSSSRSSR